MRSLLIKILYTIFGNRLSYRFGRALYMYARHESGIDMKKNGEFRIQKEFSKRLSHEEEQFVVFDIGANIGNWTVSLLSMIPDQKTNGIDIHVFEPIHDTFEILKNTIESNSKGKQVKLNCNACSSKTGSDKMFIATTNAGSNSLYKGAVHNGLLSESIEKITLDEYCTDNNVAKIHFIKSDTEGHEVEVLRGSQKLFTEERIMVFQLEYNQLWCYSRFFMKDVFDFLEGMPYLIGKISPHGLSFYRKWHPEIERFFESNYLIVHKDALDWFNHEIGSYDDRYYYKVEK